MTSPPPSPPSRRSRSVLVKTVLGMRARGSYLAHLLKAVFQQHHKEIQPLFSEMLAPEAIVLEAGAHAGQYTKLLSRICRAGHVYAMEPGGYARRILKIVLRFHRLKNVKMMPCGLGDKPGTAELSVPVKRGHAVGFGLSHLGRTQKDEKRPCTVETVDIETIDSLAEKENLPRVDLIKADIEGWERRLLAGAENTLDRFSPFLMLEVVNDALARAGDNAGELWDFLAQKGYSGYRLEADASLSPVERGAQGDLIFVPADRSVPGTINKS